MGSLLGFKVLAYVQSDWKCLRPDVRADVSVDYREVLSLILPKSLRMFSVRVHDDCYQSSHEELIDHALQTKTGPDVLLPLFETLNFTITPATAFEA